MSAPGSLVEVFEPLSSLPLVAIFTRWRPEEDEEPPATALGAGPGLVGLSVTNRF